LPTQSESQLPVYSAIPANLSAVTCTTATTNYLVGFTNGPGSSTLSAATVIGATVLPMTAVTNFYQGEAVLIDGGTSKAELVLIQSINSSAVTLTVARFDGGILQYAHASGANVVGTSAGIQPIYSGRVNVSVSGTLTSGTAADGVTTQIALIDATQAASQSAGAVASGVTGLVLIGNVQALTSVSGFLTQLFSNAATLGGSGATNSSPSGGTALTPGKPYLFDLAVADTSVSGHTLQAKSVVWQIEEV